MSDRLTADPRDASMGSDLVARLLEAAPVGFAVFDAAGRMVQANDAFAIASHSFATRDGDEATVDAVHRDHVARAISSRAPVLDAAVEAPGGGGSAGSTWNLSFYPIEAEGEIVAVGALAFDVTRRRATEQALREREETLRLTLEETDTGVWSWTVGADEIEWSPTVADVHGLPAGTPTPQRYDEYLQLVHPEDVDALNAAVGAAVESGEGYELDFRVRPPDGSVRWVWTSASVLAGAPGRPRRLVGITRDATRRRRGDEQQAFLRRAASVLSSSLDEDRMLQELAELAVGSICDWCSFELLREGEIVSVAVAHEEPAKVALAHELRRRSPPDPAAEHGLSKVLRTGEPELWGRISDELLSLLVDDEEVLRLVRGLGLHSALIVPLLVRDRVIGAATFVSSESARAYELADLEFALDVSRSMALAVENARLFASERQARTAVEDAHARTARLQLVTELLSAATTPADVLAVVLGEARDAVGAASCLVYTQEERRLVLRGQVGVDGAAAPAELALDPPTSHPAVEAMATLSAVTVDGTEASLAAGTALAVPLLSSNASVGVAVLGFRPGLDPAPAEAALALSVGRQCAEALVRARAFEHEHDVAVTLQRSMLPQELPAISGLDIAARYLPGVHGLHVGGDWFDAVAVDGALAITVGDVVGKGVFAAAAMGQLRNAVRVYALEGYAPGEVVARLSERADDLSTADFATFVHLVIDPVSGTCRYASAGHPPPFLVHGAGGTSRLLDARSVPLGAGPAACESGTVAITAGDAVVLYSDGLVERRARPLGPGLDALESALRTAPRNDALSILEHVLGELDVTSREDDVVALVVRRHGVDEGMV